MCRFLNHDTDLSWKHTERKGAFSISCFIITRWSTLIYYSAEPKILSIFAKVFVFLVISNVSYFSYSCRFQERIRMISIFQEPNEWNEKSQTLSHTHTHSLHIAKSFRISQCHHGKNIGKRNVAGIFSVLSFVHQPNLIFHFSFSVSFFFLVFLLIFCSTIDTRHLNIEHNQIFHC